LIKLVKKKILHYTLSHQKILSKIFRLRQYLYEGNYSYLATAMQSGLTTKSNKPALFTRYL